MRRLGLALAALALSFAADAQPAAAAATPPRMAVVETPSNVPGDTFVVFYSGDGGWAAIDKSVSAELAKAGMPVAGVNALTYFFTRRTADEAAADLAAVIDTYSQRWGRPKVVLAGYSFGADALPLIVPKLPPKERDAVKLVAMLSPDQTGELVFHPTDWLNMHSSDEQPLAPALVSIRSVPTLCIYAEGDRNDACPLFSRYVDKVTPLPGNHHFGGHYDAVAQAIEAALRAPG